ncbi:AFG1/ZapE family ATPase, partial [Streptomyces scabiei]|uniref:AFG1/ZapE family ATPase n=1 Tax=Streptomyces scabiei TaxID=1930 RepID=UPI0038F7730A
PNALGEGRFAAQDFLREIHAMAASFQTLRIDGTDYRQRAIDGHALALDDAAFAQALTDAAARGTASDDAFGALIGHLAAV